MTYASAGREAFARRVKEIQLSSLKRRTWPRGALLSRTATSGKTPVTSTQLPPLLEL
jgi:hypothetical protein